MHIKFIVVGKLKEKFWQQAIAEYAKRLQPYVKLTIVELADEKIPDPCSDHEAVQLKNREGARIVSHIGRDDVVIALAIQGKLLTSEQLAEFVEEHMMHSGKTLVFLIGGSLGLADEVYRRCQLQLSFGKMTLPHQLMRVVLVEQVYRAVKIIRGEPYHK